MLPTAVSTATTTSTTGGVGAIINGNLNGPISDIELSSTAGTTYQPMDWLFKKERIYWLAQFWQQKALLAEKEISTLKDQLTPDQPSKIPTSESFENNKSSTFDLTTTKLTSSSPTTTIPLSQIQTATPLLTLPPNAAASILNNFPLLNGTTNPLNGTIPTGISSLLTSNLGLNGNFIATAPSPSPPLSDNESVTSVTNNHNTNDDSDITHQNNNLNSTNSSRNNNNSNNSNKSFSNELKENKKFDENLRENLEDVENYQDNNACSRVDFIKLKENINTKREENIRKYDQNISKNSSNDLKDSNSSDNDDLVIITNDERKLDSDEDAIHKKSDHIKNDQMDEIDSTTKNNEHLNKESDNDDIEMHDIEKQIDFDSPKENTVSDEKQNSENKILKEYCKTVTSNDEEKNNENACDSSAKVLQEKLATKDNTIKLLSEEIKQLKILYEQQVIFNKRLQEDLQEKLNVILRLESHLNNNNASKSNVENDDKSIELSKSSETPPLIAGTAIKEEKSDDDQCLSPSVKEKTEKDENFVNASKESHITELCSSERKSEDTVQNEQEKLQTNLTNNAKIDLTENTTNCLQQMAASASFAGSHLPNPFHVGLQLAAAQFSAHNSERSRDYSRFSDEMHFGSSSNSNRFSADLLIPKSDPMEAKLQEMLRYGLDKYANHNLDTLYISRRVRELLSVHNIGQRIFAKYILGLSQGTVSELLSKPKPWDKLTEKGRDSYRKMHAWACDESAILLLKSLIPKKESNLPPFGYSDSERSNDDRLQAHYLSDSPSPILPKHNIHMSNSLGASFPMNSKSFNTKDEDSRSTDDLKSPVSINRSLTPNSVKDSKTTPDISINQEESPKRDYQEELIKIMSRNQRESTQVFPKLLFPQLYGNSGNNGNIPPQMANLEMAFESYHRELAKFQNINGTTFPNFNNLLSLQQQQLSHAVTNSAVQDLSLSKTEEKDKDGIESENLEKSRVQTNDSGHDLRENNREDSQEKSMHSTNSRSQTPSKDGNMITSSILPPTSDDFSNSINPLQRMASITNSLITQPPLPPLHTQSPKPTKTVLPPITQQQFDLYNNLNTEDIVRNVKEALSQYSISQRLFGENVLGLSQGSVSDLLARPKPWHMLTQKGREPFIRMKMFLEDESAVHKLVASQYKIAPEKLMRTGNYTGTPQIPTSLATKIDDMQNPSMQRILNDLKFKEQQLMNQMRAANTIVNIPTSQHQAAAAAAAALQFPPPPSIIPPFQMKPDSGNSISSKSSISNGFDRSITSEKKLSLPSTPASSPQPTNVMRNGQNQHMSPTVYEMAALTQDLDTHIITTRVKEVLLANNIGQKIFGEAVLGLSQGSVSELLSKPKPWHMLSIKGREPFIRMQLWLSDINNVERLTTLKNEQREASKRRRSIGPGGGHDNSDTSSNDTNDFYTTSPGPNSVGSNGLPPNKKQRVLFSEEQKEALRLAFTLDPYPNVTTIEFLANELGLATRTITNWFHNHRMRLKQQIPHGQPVEQIPSRENQTGPPLDPVQFKILLNQRLMEMQKDKMGLSGVPLMYPPYFGGNPNLAALIASRGLFGASEADFTALNMALKNQFGGIDLSINNNNENEHSNKQSDFSDLNSENDKTETGDVSDNDSVHEKPEIYNNKSLDKNNDENDFSLAMNSQLIRSSRRKATAPQWVNPEWQPISQHNTLSDSKGNANDKTEEFHKNGNNIFSTLPGDIKVKEEKEDDELNEESDNDEQNKSPNNS